jgi:phage-related tail fiber protein
MSSDSPFTLGTSDANFTQFSGAGQIVAGSGLTKTGNTLNVQTASSSRIVVNADNIDLATTAVTAGTYTSVTVDSYGRVTNGTNPVTVTSDTQTFDNSDLVAGLLSVVHPLNKKYVSVILTDNTDRIFVPDQVLYIDTDELQIDMTSFGTITGTYTLTLLA